MSAWVSFSSPVSNYCEAVSVSMSASTPPMAGGAKRRAQARDFYFSKKQDDLSPKLFLASAQGTRFSSVWVEIYNQNSSLPYLTYKLSDVIIVSFQSSGNFGGYVKPIEQIGLDFAEIKIEYG